jgi:hypothetical protein
MQNKQHIGNLVAEATAGTLLALLDRHGLVMAEGEA